MGFLVGTVVADAVGVALLGKAQGFGRPAPLVAGVLALLLGFVLFSYATRTIPASLANAVWAGASIVLVVVLGRFFLRESLSLGQYACLGVQLALSLPPCSWWAVCCPPPPNHGGPAPRRRNWSATSPASTCPGSWRGTGLPCSCWTSTA